MRVLMLSGYNHPSHHRKAELLADAPEVELWHILQPGNGKEPGLYPSANGQRQYRVQVLPLCHLGQPGDPHRTIHWPPRFGLHTFKPQIIYCEHEQESLMALEVALARWAGARRAPLVLYSWQNILRARSLPVRLACALTLRAANHVVCATTEAVQVLQRQGYHGSTSVMPLFGLDTRLFHPQPAARARLRQELGLDKFVVGYVGRLVAAKGVDLLLRAVARCQFPMQVLLVGSGPERTSLMSLAGELGIRERCRFLEAMPYDAMAEYLNVLDLLVLPSRSTPNWKEQYGRVLVEAMACRVMVAGAASGAIPEVLDTAGRLFPENDSEALASLLDEVYRDPHSRQRLAACGYQRALTHYTVEHLAVQTLALWHSLLQQEGKAT